MRIGVFDSGIGGRAIAQSLSAEFPDDQVTVVDDHEHVPYGTRASSEIITLSDAAIQPLLMAECDVIVIACNTATAVAIEILRSRYPSQKFIGLEPMVKPAPALSKSGTIAVLATPATLASERYRRAKQLYAPNMQVVEPDCSDWASLIEANQINREHIDTVVQECLEKNADVIVLACTHYHWIKDEIEQSAQQRARVIEPSEAIVRRVRELLKL